MPLFYTVGKQRGCHFQVVPLTPPLAISPECSPHALRFSQFSHEMLSCLLQTMDMLNEMYTHELRKYGVGSVKGQLVKSQGQCILQHGSSFNAS
jgi:hypothetical protein